MSFSVFFFVMYNTILNKYNVKCNLCLFCAQCIYYHIRFVLIIHAYVYSKRDLSAVYYVNILLYDTMIPTLHTF